MQNYLRISNKKYKNPPCLDVYLHLSQRNDVVSIKIKINLRIKTMNCDNFLNYVSCMSLL